MKYYFFVPANDIKTRQCCWVRAYTSMRYKMVRKRTHRPNINPLPFGSVMTPTAMLHLDPRLVQQSYTHAHSLLRTLS